MAAPEAPSGLTATRFDDDRTNLSWDRNSFPGSTYDDQQIQRWSNVSDEWTSSVDLAGGADTYSATGLSANRRYRWRVRALNEDGTSAWTYSNFMQTTPTAPSGAAVVQSSTTSVTVSWDNNATTREYDYVTALEQQTNGGAWTEINVLAQGVTSATITGLTAGNTYRFRVRTRSTVGATTNSGYSTSASLLLLSTPAAPSGVSATRVSDSSATLTWTNNPSTSAPYTGIVIGRWDSVTNTWTTIFLTTTVTTTSFTDVNTVANRKYRYRVMATNPWGNSGYVESGYTYNTPAAPTSVTARATGSATITVDWVNGPTYTEHTMQVTPYKNGVAQTPQNVAGTSTSFVLTGADYFSTYYFVVKAISTVGSLESGTATSNSVLAAAAPNAPANLAPVGAADLALATVLSWAHSPSQDGSAQTKYELRHRVVGSPTWTSTGTVTSTVSSRTLAAGTYANGQSIEWEVRTWGVHADPSPWSATATILGSATPTVTITGPATTINASSATATWTYFDAESSAQSGWEASLYDSTGTVLIERLVGDDASTSVTFATVLEDGVTYRASVRVRDGAGIWSSLATRTFTVTFIPPAEVNLSAEYDESSGVVICTLTPTAHDGVTTLAPSSVTIQRRIWDDEISAFGDWESVADNVSPTATIIDTTAPIFGDGEYRAVTYSSLPSAFVPTVPVTIATPESKWLYVSGGDNFDVVCRMWANIEIGWKTSRSKALHYFAGRRKPVLYSGEQVERVLTVSGILATDIDDGTSGPHEWLYLGRQAGPVLLRAPGRRIYGALSEVNIDRISANLHRVSFSIQEVDR